MNEKISYIKLPNITTSNLQDVVNFLDDNEIEYVEYYAEDLQNRNDKAIEYIEKHSSFINYLSPTREKEIGSLEMRNVRELLDILKESGNKK